MQIGSVTVILNVGMLMNFIPYFPYLFTILGDIRDECPHDGADHF